MVATDFRARELLNYWRACREIRHGDEPEAGLDEIYGILSNSEWPMLLNRCVDIMAAPEALALP